MIQSVSRNKLVSGAITGKLRSSKVRLLFIKIATGFPLFTWLKNGRKTTPAVSNNCLWGTLYVELGGRGDYKRRSYCNETIWKMQSLHIQLVFMQELNWRELKTGKAGAAILRKLTEKGIIAFRAFLHSGDCLWGYIVRCASYWKYSGKVGLLSWRHHWLMRREYYNGNMIHLPLVARPELLVWEEMIPI